MLRMQLLNGSYVLHTTSAFRELKFESYQKLINFLFKQMLRMTGFKEALFFQQTLERLEAQRSDF